MGKLIPFKPKAGTPSKDLASRVTSRPAAVFYADREGHFDFVNVDWCRLTKCNQSDALGDGWLNAVHAEDRLHVARRWRDAIANEKFLSISFRLARTSPLHVVFQAVPQYDGESYLSGYSGTLMALEPVNSQIRTTAAQSLLLPSVKDAKAEAPGISASVQRLHEAIDLAGLYYFEHDLIAGTTYRSKPLRSLFGGNRSIAELTAALHPEDAPKFWDNHNRAQASRIPWVNEYRVRFPGCEAMHVKSQGQFSFDCEGKPTAIFGFTLPIAGWNASWSSSAVELLHKIAIAPN